MLSKRTFRKRAQQLTCQSGSNRLCCVMIVILISLLCGSCHLLLVLIVFCPIRSHLKTLEESYQRREQRLKDETELIIAQSNEKIKNLEAEKADLEGSNNRKIVILETAKNGEIERLKDVHRCALEQFRQEHEEEMQHLRKLKDQEVSAATSAHAHTRSLQALMDQVLNSTREVSDLRQKIEITHKSGLDERELSARARDEYLKQLQERLLRQQSENDEERARLQGK